MEHWLVRAAQMHPGRVAIGEITYAALLERARRMAGWLAEQGVSAGERAGIALPPGEGFAVALHGCLLARVVAVPIDVRLGRAEREAFATGTSVVIEAEHAGPALEPVETVDAGAIATVMHTSGTTARPRPVPLTHANWLASALGSAVALGLDDRERWLCPMPLVHVGGLSILIRSAIYGTTALVPGRFETGAVLAALSDPEPAITLVSLVPTMLARLLDAGLERPPTLRWALLGGGPISPALLERAERAGVPVAPTYGMTEACSQIATFGWPLAGVELRLDGEEQEILVRGPMVSEAALGEDGWLHTGDLGAFDPRGRLVITGRASDTIITGGENVSPVEVEHVLMAHPAVADAAVVGRPDPEWGEALVALVVGRSGARVDAEELRAHCRSHLAAFKVPKAVEVTDRLPRSPSGKLLRRQLS